jgi:cytoplasmic iron level regulating protein YaaA (DUF328/UPF0246 family)
VAREGVLTLLILLPPSETKAEHGTGRRLNLDGLSFPELRAPREAVLDALIQLCVRDEPGALASLGLAPGQLDDVRRNTGLRAARTVPVARLYTGVLYDALDLGSLDPGPYRQLKRSIVIFSGLWGALRLDDRIPPYRCSMGAKLPGFSSLASYWKGVLDGPLTRLAGGGLVLDLRSSMYTPAWTPTGALAQRTVAVRVLHERTAGGVTSRGVVSHFNKATKGRLVRDLARAEVKPRSVRQLVAALRELKYTVEEHPRRLDVIVTEV